MGPNSTPDPESPVRTPHIVTITQLSSVPLPSLFRQILPTHLRAPHPPPNLRSLGCPSQLSPQIVTFFASVSDAMSTPISDVTRPAVNGHDS